MAYFFASPLNFDILNDRFWPILLKNSVLKRAAILFAM